MKATAALLVASTTTSVLLAGCGAGREAASPARTRLEPPLVAPAPAASAPAPVPVALNSSTTCGIRDLREHVLSEVNELRASGAQCGARHMPAAPPLEWRLCFREIFDAADPTV